MALPPEIIEIILSKLSVKPLLRFKSVNKSWNAIISDPVFVRNHHHRQLSNDPKNLFLLKNSRVSSQGFSLVKLEECGNIQTLRPIFGPYLLGILLCSCEGLLLITDSSYQRLLLWNPSIRTHTDLHESPFHYGGAAFGLCRDPITDDFKVVVLCWYNYSVYSCNNKSWTEKDFHESDYRGYCLGSDNSDVGVCVDGASYWVWSNHCVTAHQIVYFDPRDDEFKFLQKPENADDSKSMYLVDLRGFLCLYSEGRDYRTIEIWTKGKGIGNSSWNKFVTIRNVETSIELFEPQCLVGNNKIVIRIKRMKNGDDGLVVYSCTDESFTEFEDTKVFGLGLVPYMDTLFFPVEKSSQVVTGKFGFPIEK